MSYLLPGRELAGQRRPALDSTVTCEHSAALVAACERVYSQLETNPLFREAFALPELRHIDNRASAAVLSTAPEEKVAISKLGQLDELEFASEQPGGSVRRLQLALSGPFHRTTKNCSWPNSPSSMLGRLSAGEVGARGDRELLRYLGVRLGACLAARARCR